MQMVDLTHASLIEESVSLLSRYESQVGESARRNIKQLRRDIENELFIVSVLGEFKRGKSTLLNALIGQELLPSDVTPTTAVISVLRYSFEPKLIIHWSDGRTENQELSQKSLLDFTADANFDPDDVDYLEIGIPSDVLKEGLVLVDTPGVDDLNRHRSEVACRFVPRSDAVIFVLSAASPVKRTEVEFLETSILDSGLERMLFVLNFADACDDLEKTIVATERRLAPALSGRTANIIATSASLALQSVVGNSNESSNHGMDSLRAGLANLASSESRIATRESRLLHRIRLSLRECSEDVEQELSLAQRDIESLRTELATIEAAISRKQERKERLDFWLEDRRAEILSIVRKSLRHFQDELTDVILEWVEDYKAPDFKEFVEEKIPQRLMKHCKMWIESYTGPINSLLGQLDSRIVSALGEEFEAHVSRLHSERPYKFDGLDALKLNANDVSQIQPRAGMLAAGAAGLMLLLHASVFVPVVGLVAFPFLLKKMTDDGLKSAKDKLRPELELALNQSLDTFAERVISSVSSDIDTLRSSAEARFDELMNELKGRISEHIRERGTSSEVAQGRAKSLSEALGEFERANAEVKIALGIQSNEGK